MGRMILTGHCRFPYPIVIAENRRFRMAGSEVFSSPALVAAAGEKRG